MKYNYDNAWEFKKLEVQYDRIDTVRKKTSQGVVQIVTNESDLTPKGSYSVTFNGVTPPGPSEEIRVSAKITIKKAGELDLTNSADPALVLPPP